MSDLEARAARRGRRRPGAPEALAPAPDRSAGYRHLQNPFEPLRVFSDDQVNAVHQAALDILETQGMKVLSADGRARYAAGGAQVDEDSMLVRLDRGLVTECLGRTPHELTLHGLEAIHDVPLSGRNVAMAPTSGPPNIMDIENGRRAGTLQDFCNLMKLCQSFEVIQVLGGAVEPQDVHVNVRHLEVMRAQLLLTDKIPFIFSRGRGQIADNFALLQIALGLSPEEFARAAVHLHGHQHQFTTPAGHPDVRGHRGIRPGGAAHDHHALYPGRGHGTGDDRRSTRPWRMPRRSQASRSRRSHAPAPR